ncbi:MAG: Nramp family divalent metal transporter [Aureispira sp.]
MSTASFKNTLQRLGPGLLFAGAAIGVSHLVYATRAGATYGFGLLWLIVIANLFKYPFFEFGPRYAAATGESLLHGYRRLGRWVLAGFILVALATMFTVQAAVTLVTASLATYLFGGGSMLFWSALLLFFCALLLLWGRYQFLDGLMKVIITLLTIVTLITVVVAFFKHPEPLILQQQFPLDKIGLTFVVAFMGWLPAPLDLSVWHSLWALQKQGDRPQNFSLSAALFDFKIGYLGTTLLALFFMALGALVMFQSGVELSSKNTVFAQQLIELYTKVLGKGFGIFVGIAAFITMFSTTLTCLDAMPRAMGQAQALWTSTETPNKAKEQQLYKVWLAVLILGALLILQVFLTNILAFLLIVTVLSFLTAPFFAIANSILVTRYLPKEQQPKVGLKILSGIGILYLFVFCGLYLWNLVYNVV